MPRMPDVPVLRPAAGLAPVATLTAVVAETALGFAGVALSEAGIRHATLFHHTREACEHELQANGAGEGDDPRRASVVAALAGYARGEGALLDTFPVDLPPCTVFQRKTWLALRSIPFGETQQDTQRGLLATHLNQRNIRPIQLAMTGQIFLRKPQLPASKFDLGR